MKILFHSNWPLANTGYGTQTAMWCPRFRDLGHDVAISALWGFSNAALEWEGMHVYPADGDWGNRTLTAFAAMHGDGEECQVISLIDPWVMSGDSIKDLRLAAWTPVDHDPVQKPTINFFNRTGATPIAMSLFGKAQLEKAGLQPLYVPHGVDTDVFRPSEDSVETIREEMGVPADAFVVGMVAANKGDNPSRKAFPQVFQAFAQFREQKRDAILYIHSDRTGRTGVNLDELRDACDIPRPAVKFTDQLEFEFGLKPEKLARLYGAMDVLANPSFGEGFGIPIVEAQACGTPVIVSNWTAMPELLGAGWLVGGEPWYDSKQGSFFLAPSISELVGAFLSAYDEAGGLRSRARTFGCLYDVENVLERYWMPVLEQLEAPREVPALNREVVAA